MEPIDYIATEWKDRVPKEVRESVSYTDREKAPTSYAVPLNIHRLNTLFYNKAIFAEIGKDPQKWTKLGDLFEAAAQIKNHKWEPQRTIAPIALGYGQDQTWTLALLFFENLMVGHRQGELYEQLFGNPMAFDPFAHQYHLPDGGFPHGDLHANDDAYRLPWDKAMNLVLKGRGGDDDHG